MTLETLKYAQKMKNPLKQKQYQKTFKYKNETYKTKMILWLIETFIRY